MGQCRDASYAAAMQRSPGSTDTDALRHEAASDLLSVADVLSARIKELLGQAVAAPETLDPSEIRELAASVLFYLATLSRQEAQADSTVTIT